jgi:hypothetical protein
MAETAREPVRPHQPGQADFRAILPEEIEWKPECGTGVKSKYLTFRERLMVESVKLRRSHAPLRS